MSKVKLLHVLYAGQGGLGTYFMNFVNADKSRLFKHHAFFYGIEPMYQEYENFCRAHEIEFTYVERKGKLDLNALRLCRQLIEKSGISHVLLHTFSMTPLNFYFKSRAKVIAIDHTAHQWKTRLEWVFLMINQLFAYKSIFFFQGQFDVLKKKMPFLKQGKNTHFIPKVVDTDLFAPLKDGNQNAFFTVGISSRLVKGKRHDLLIKAVAALKEADRKVLLKIAGDGPEAEHLKQLTEQKKLTDQVEFCGNLKLDEMVGFYQSLDAYIHASDGETICYSIMEAQACGLPILASDVEGINTVIEDRKDGILFSNEVVSIKEALLMLSSDKALSKVYAKKSRDLAEFNSSSFNPVTKLYEVLKITN